MKNKFKRIDKKIDKRGWLHTDDEVVAAIKLAKGFLTPAAEALGITYQAIWNRGKRKGKIKDVIEATREKHLDFTERKLLENIKEGKEASIFFHLRCLGKRRGYVERQEITGADGSPIQLTLEHRLGEIMKQREQAIQKAIQKGEYVGDRSLRTETGEFVNGNGLH